MCSSFADYLWQLVRCGVFEKLLQGTLFQVKTLSMGEPAKAASCLLALLVCAASWSTASAFVDPNTLQQFFIIRRIDPLECTPSYNEYYRGSTHLTPLSTWNCENKLTLGQPFLPFGSYTCFLGDRSGSRGIERLRQCMEAFPAYFAFPAFSIPGVDPVGVPTADWYNIWIDKGARSRLYGSVWTAQKNWRYSSIGDYWIGTNDGQTGWYTKPPANSTYLIHSDCLTPCKTAMPGYAPTGVWSNKNNFATDDDVSVYYVGHNVFNFTDFRFFYGTSKAQGDFAYPKDQMCLKQECVKNEQLQGMYQGPVTYDWSAIAPRLTTVIGGHDAINNPSGAGITRTMTLQATQTDTATLQLTNSFGFSTGMEYSESLKFGLDAAIAKGEATLNFKTSFSFTTNSAMQSTSTTTNTQQLTNTFTIVVPAWNSVECNYLLQQADNIDIPFQQTFYYKAVSYAGSEPTPLTSKQAISALLTSTGFDGEVLDYFPTNKSVKAVVNGTLHVSTVLQTSINCTCVPTPGAPSGCPQALAVGSATGASAAAAAERQSSTKRLRIRGKRAEYIYDRTPSKNPVPPQPGHFIPTDGPAHIPRYPLKRAPAGTMYYHITHEQLHKISETQYGAPPTRDE